MSLFPEERRQSILRILNERGKLTVEDMCLAFSVTPATVRADLNLLAGKGLLTRTHGGAVSVNRAGFEMNNREKEALSLRQKKEIALEALRSIDDGDTIALDAGTTVLELAKLLKGRDVNCVTNDLYIASVLEEAGVSRVHILGGRLRPGYHCTLGSAAVNEMRSFHVDKAFLGANSVSASFGASTPDAEHAALKRAMTECCDRAILLATGDKFARKSFVSFAPASAFHTMITDATASQEEIARLTLLNIDVRVVCTERNQL